MITIDGQFFTDLYVSPEGWRQSTRMMLDSCTRIVCWFNDADGDICRNLHAFGLNAIIVQSPVDRALSEKFIEDRYLETLFSWNLEPETAREKLRIADAQGTQCHDKESTNCRKMCGRVIAIHPGSGSPHKCVEPSLLATVATRLLAVTNTRLFILSGPADGQSVRALCSLLPADSFKVVAEHSLTSIVSHLSDVHLFIGHDSGLSHLAVACGIPSVVLFGPTDPSQWAPRGTSVSVIQGNSCECTDWSSIRQCQHKPCLKISADRIVQESERWLTRSASGGRSSFTECELTSCP